MFALRRFFKPDRARFAFSGANNTVRITVANNDVNHVREFERQTGPVCSIAYSSDGNLLAVGTVGGEARLYKTSDGSRMTTLKGNAGAVFAIAFNPQTKQVATSGFDGQVRIFDVASGERFRSFLLVPLQTAAATTTSPK